MDELKIETDDAKIYLNDALLVFQRKENDGAHHCVYMDCDESLVLLGNLPRLITQMLLNRISFIERQNDYNNEQIAKYKEHLGRLTTIAPLT